MKYFVFLTLSAVYMFSCSQPKEEVSETVQEVIEVPAEVMGAVLTQEKYVPEITSAMDAMGQGNVSEFTKIMSDDVVYMFNYLDSLVGKQAVNDWWQNRFDNDLRSISFDQNIWLTVDVKDPQYPSVEPGDHVLLWTVVTGTYSTGKSMTQFIHMVYHFNSNGQVDRVTQFVDRVPIMQANAM